VSGVAQEGPEAATDFAFALAKAREIAAESPETTRARARLDHALNQAETEAEQSAAHRARARAMLAAGLPKLARMNAGFAARFAPLDSAAWKLRAEVEAACGANVFAAACQGIAQDIAREAGAAERFAAAFAQLHADDQNDLRITIDGTLEEHPQSAPFKELKAIIDRIAPEKN